MKLAARVNTLRCARLHLESQVQAGIDTQRATLEEAVEALRVVERQLAKAEAEARDVPECAYLFGQRFRKTTQKAGTRTDVLPPALQSSPTSKEDDMARKSKKAELEDTLVALRKAEKSAGSTKWALSGKGAEKNPPSPERKAHLEAKLAREQALVAELRAKRDELKA